MTNPGRERAPRVRYDRAVALGTSLVVVLVAFLGALGAIPKASQDVLQPVAAHPPAHQSARNVHKTAHQAAGSSTSTSAIDRAAKAAAKGATKRSKTNGTSTPATSTPSSSPSSPSTTVPSGQSSAANGESAPVLPAASGSGRRIVFSITDQRVWLVDAAGRPISTYLVSGSLTDNLKPGTYAVFSKSRWATGIDNSGVMQYFVRFAHGQNAAIGFHSIPTKDGKALQTKAQLGTPQSHGCIRQAWPDAIALWNFAPVGTEVVVTS